MTSFGICFVSKQASIDHIDDDEAEIMENKEQFSKHMFRPYSMKNMTGMVPVTSKIKIGLDYILQRALQDLNCYISFFKCY